MSLDVKSSDLNKRLDLKIQEIKYDITIPNKATYAGNLFKIQYEILEQITDKNNEYLLHVSWTNIEYTILNNTLKKIFISLDFDEVEKSIYSINPSKFAFTYKFKLKKDLEQLIQSTYDYLRSIITQLIKYHLIYREGNISFQ